MINSHSVYTGTLILKECNISSFGVFCCFLGQLTKQPGTVNQHLFVRIQILLCPTDRTEGDYDVSLVQFISQLRFYQQKSTCIHALISAYANEIASVTFWGIV